MNQVTGAARRQFQAHIESLRELAKEKNLDFHILLNSFMPAQSNNLRLAALLQKSDARETEIIERYRPYYYEWLIDLMMPDAEAHHRHLLGRIRGGKARAEQARKQSRERQNKILLKRAELIASGCKPRSINKGIAKALNEETDYVRKCLAGMNKTPNVAGS